MAGLTQNYHETCDPSPIADEAAITLATTYKALMPVSRYNLGTQFFNKPGRKLWIRMFGKMTTLVTPGNGQIGILFGTGADNNGVIVAQSGAFSLAAAQTNLSWFADFYITCRSTGTVGTLFGHGFFKVTDSVQALMQHIPASAAVVSAAVDLTGTLVPSIQFLRSGSTVETITVQDYHISPMN